MQLESTRALSWLGGLLISDPMLVIIFCWDVCIYPLLACISPLLVYYNKRMFRSYHSTRFIVRNRIGFDWHRRPAIPPPLPCRNPPACPVGPGTTSKAEFNRFLDERHKGACAGDRTSNPPKAEGAISRLPRQGWAPISGFAITDEL